MPAIIGEQPHPRALLLNFSGNSILEEERSEVERIGALFPTWRVIANLGEVEAREWDVLVLKTSNPNPSFYVNFHAEIPRHLYVIQFGYGLCDRMDIPGKLRPQGPMVGFLRTSRATEFARPDELPPELAQVVREQLEPAVARRDEQHRLLDSDDWRSGKDQSAEAVRQRSVEWKRQRENIRPFLLTNADKGILAGSFRRCRSEAEFWAIPSDVDDPSAWVAAALREWETKDDRIFPRAVEWKSDTRWRTPGETEAAAKLSAVHTKREKALQALDEEEGTSKAELERATELADQSERRLLTGKGDELVVVVAKALRRFEFEVEEMDAVWPADDRREDLRVRDGENDDWVAIAEVRSYKGGATISDLLRIAGRFVPRFVEDEGRQPDAAWYVVNQFNERPPSTRPVALHSNESEVNGFADDARGAVISTVPLFELWMAVEIGDVPTEKARRLLRECRGRFEFVRTSDR